MRERFTLTQREFRQLPSRWQAQPKAVRVITGRWEEPGVTVSTSDAPPIGYDYYGFPEHTYRIQYPAPGSRRDLCPSCGARVCPSSGVRHIARAAAHLWTMCFPTCPRIGGKLAAGNLPFAGVGLRRKAAIERDALYFGSSARAAFTISRRCR